MTKQEIQNKIKDAVLSAEIYESNFIAEIEFKNFADEPTIIQVEIAIEDIEQWIDISGMLTNTIDQFNPEKGHYQILDFTPIKEFDITDEIIKEYIRTNNEFIIL